MAYLADIAGLTITGRFWILSLVNSCTMNLPLLRIIEEEPVLFPEPAGEALLTCAIQSNLSYDLVMYTGSNKSCLINQDIHCHIK